MFLSCVGVVITRDHNETVYEMKIGLINIFGFTAC